MGSARTNQEHHATAVGHPNLAKQHRQRASKLFEKDHAYAARLVQIPTAIHSVVRSTTTTKLLDRLPAEVELDDRITAGIVTQPRANGGGS
jgi:hypothetical protein